MQEARSVTECRIQAYGALPDNNSRTIAPRNGKIRPLTAVSPVAMTETPASPKTESLNKLQARSREMGELGARILTACGGNCYPLDMLFLAALNRTFAQISGFVSMLGARNFICAAPLIRMQLDTALRLYAGTLVDDPHDFTVSVLQGTPVRRLRSREGKKMTDAYLVEKLAVLYPWVSDVYAHTSGYIHLSEKHFFSSVGALGADNVVTFKISAQDSNVTSDDYEEAVEAFSAALDIVRQLAVDWVFAKENPEAVAKLQGERAAVETV